MRHEACLGTDIRYQSECMHCDAHERLMSASVLQEREGAPDSPVIMNPMRHNIPAHIRNAEDLKALGEV